MTPPKTAIKRRLPLRLIALSIIFFAGLLAPASPVWAQTPAQVGLTANPSVIMADGQSTTIISAQVSSSAGHAVPDGTVVRFTTTSGTLSASSVTVTAGIARVTLTSSPLAGTAVVSATFLGAGGGATGQITVEFTNDKDLANSDRNDEEWIRVSSKEYLEYSADDQIIDAAAPKHGTHMSYQGMSIDADALQVDIQAQEVHARNAIVRLGDKELIDAALLSYNLASHQGQAIVTDDPNQRMVGNVTLSGRELKESAQAASTASGDSSSKYSFADISASRVLIVASAVAVRPNDRIQLKHASIFVDGKKIVSMPYQVMPLSTDQIFGQQVLGYGTDGLVVNVPYYFSVSPSNTGTLYLRSEAASEENGTFYTGRTGLSLDMDESYGQSDGPSHGDFQLMGLTRGDWSASWTHSQNFGGGTRGYFYFNSPEHQGLLASGNLIHQFPHLTFNLNASETTTPSQDGYSSESHTLDAYLQTDPHLLFGGAKRGLDAVGVLSAQDNQTHIGMPGGASTNTTYDTKGAGIRFFTPMISLDRKTSLTDSVNFEQDYNQTSGQSGLTIGANLGATERLAPTTSATFSYSYTHNPFLAQPHLASLPNAAFLLLNPVDKHDFNLSFLTGPPSGKWNFSFATTYEMPTQNESASAAINYRLSPAWGLGVDDYLDKLGYFTYQDLEFSLSRRIGSRDFVLSWDTLYHRFQFNLGASQF